MTRTDPMMAPHEPRATVVPDLPRAVIASGTGTPTEGQGRYLQQVADPGDTARLLVEYVRTTTPAAAAQTLTVDHPGGWWEVAPPAAAASGSCFCHQADHTWHPDFVTQVLVNAPDNRLAPHTRFTLYGEVLSLGRSVEYVFRIEVDGLRVFAYDGAHASSYGTVLSPAAFLAWDQPVNAAAIADSCARLRERSSRMREDELAGMHLTATINMLRNIEPEQDLVLYLVSTTIKDKTLARAVRRALAKATGTTQNRLPAHLATLTRAEQLDLLRTVRTTLTATQPPLA